MTVYVEWLDKETLDGLWERWGEKGKMTKVEEKKRGVGRGRRNEISKWIVTGNKGRLDVELRAL